MGSASRMQVLTFRGPGTELEIEERPIPKPGAGEVLLRVRACGICRTDLHILDGELTEPHLPLVLGHQIVGEVVEAGPDAEGLEPGRRVGVPWLATTCGACRACRSGRENLCPEARFTGYHRDGGLGEYCTAAASSCLPLPEGEPEEQIAPLLCAGLIGHRALRMAGDARRIGFYGFGAAAHILTQVAAFEGREIYAFTRAGDTESQGFARELGACWAGASEDAPPEELDAAILFAPVGGLVPLALRAVAPGGTVVCAGIHMSDIPSFPYSLLWGERTLCSVANLTHRDGEEFLALAPRVPVRTAVTRYALADAPRALEDLRHGRFQGAAVVVP